MAWKKLEDMNIIGKRYPRVEAVDKVTGKAKYAYDINSPGLLFAQILRCPHANAKIVKIDTSKAEKLPGVKAIVTAPELGIMKTAGHTCRYQGDHVAAVAAIREDILDDALALIEVEYEQLPFVVNEEDAMKPDAPKLTEQGNVRGPRVNDRGDINKGFQEAAVIVEGEYRTQVQTHSCLEPHGGVAKWDGDHLTAWASTQGVFSVQNELANFFKIPASQVTVITEYMGAGFGSKFGAGVEIVTAAFLAKKTGAPVKLMLTRRDEHLTAGNRPSSIHRIRAGATKDGKLVAFENKSYGTGGFAGTPYIYVSSNVHTEHSDVIINAGGARAFRAPGHPQACFATEAVMDELAEKLGMDPLEFRRLNDPNQTRQKEYTIGAEKIGWQRRNKVPGSGSGTKKRGMGMGSNTWGGGGGGTKAQVIINPDGSVEVRCGTQDIGTGTKTVINAIAAEELGLKLEDIKVRIGNTEFPPSGGSGGSTTVASVSPAIKSTTEAAKMKLFEVVAAKKFGTTADQLEAKDGKIFVKSDPSKSQSWKQATMLLGTEPISIQGEWVQGLSSSGVAGTQFAEVEVDTETGEVKVLKVVAVQDCGLIIDRLTCESQVNGGVIQAISWALLEDRLMDRQAGRQINSNFSDYKIAGTKETPELVSIMYDEPERGVIGLGEPPTIPGAAAIANAVYNAIGVRVGALPITPDKILKALAEKSGKKEG